MSKISDKRAIEKDNKIQMNIYKKYKHLQVLRYEIRLNNSRKIDHFLAKTNEKREKTLERLFDSNISKKILLNFWNKVIKNDNELLFFSTESKSNLLCKLLSIGEAKNNAIKCLSILDLINENGHRFTKEILGSNLYNKSKIVLEKLENKENYLFHVLSQIRNNIESFQKINDLLICKKL